MDYQTARQNFIQAWGALGTSWGINKTIAQIHALLLTAPEAMTADDVMAALATSRGNTNINLRELVDWGLVKKIHKPGDRKEYFEAIKDIHRVAMVILRERRKRELEPLMLLLKEYKDVKVNKNKPEEKAFVETIGQIDDFTQKVDRIFENALKSDESWLWKTLINFLK